MENRQVGLEGVSAKGDINATVNQTINYNQILQEAKQAGIPLNLPTTNVTFFAGREADLKKLHELLQNNQRVAVSAFVKGMGGVGKSELAIQYALGHLLQDYRGGVCWLRAHEGTLPTQLQDFVEVQLNARIPDGLESGEKLAQYCWKWLSDRIESQMLVVLDDVKNYDDVKPFLPPLDGKFRVLATTRSVLGNVMQQHTLDVLVLPAAVDMLKSLLPETDLRRPHTAEIEYLCEWLGRLPLAIELVGRYLARKPDLAITELQQRLDTKKLEQDALTDTQRRALAEMTAKLNVAAAFELSWQELSETAKRLACMLSLFALAPIKWQWIAMDEVDEETLEACRDEELLNLHLLEREGQGIYQLHQLLREYFQFQLQQHPEWQSLRQEVAQSLLTISKGIGQTITRDQVTEFTPAIPHLELLGREMLDDIANPEEDLVWAFWGVASFYRGQGLYASAVIPLQNCLNTTESRLGADHPNVASSLNNLAELYESQGKYSAAEPLFLRSLTISEQQLGADHPDVANSLNNLAALYQAQGQYSEAEPLFLRSLEIWEQQLGADHPSVADSLLNLAALYHNTQSHSEALQSIKRAIQIYEQKLGTEHPRTQNALSWLQLIRSAFDTAL